MITKAESKAIQAKKRRAWVDAGYRSDMASAIACMPPVDPNLRRVYHLTSVEYALSNIALGRLKVARLFDLNDPFELMAADFRARPVREVVKGFMSEFDSSTGLLCFSEDWAEPLLWSHYAAKHRGICLGFNVPKINLEKVRYRDKRIFAKLGIGQDPGMLPASLQKALRVTKYKGWNYEKEYRRFIPLAETLREGRLHFVRFGAGLELAEVILGDRCDASVESIKEFVSIKYPNAEVFSARLKFAEKFRIVPKESTIV